MEKMKKNIMLQDLSCSRANRRLKSQIVRRSKKAGIFFPVSRLSRALKRESYRARVGSTACIYMGAVLQYLAAEVLELSGNAARANFKTRIHPRHIQLAVHADPELSRLFDGVTIPAAGVTPYIHPVLMPTTNSGMAALEEPSIATTTTLESTSYTIGTNCIEFGFSSQLDDSSCQIISSTRSNGTY